MAWWNRKTTKAESVNYESVLDAINKYAKGQTAWMGQNDNAFIEEGYFANDHVYSIIRLLTRAASTLPVYLYKVVDKKAFRRYKNFQGSTEPDMVKMQMHRSKALEQIEEHPILKTIERPNPLQAWPEFCENALGFKYLLGNSYLMGIGPDGGKNAGTYQELYVLPAQHMEIKIGKGSDPIEEYVLNQHGTKIPIPIEQICHLKSWSPDYSGKGTHLYGTSPIRSGAKKIQVGNDASSTMVKMLQNMGMFGMFVLKDKDAELDPVKARELERLFYQKQRHKGRTMFSSTNFSWESAGMSPVDLAILESNKMSLRDTANLWSLSSQLLNDPDNKTYNNMKEARKAMWTNAILPDFNGFIGELNRWLVAPYNAEGGDEFVLDYDIQAIPELQEDMEKLVGYVSKMYWANFDEKRAMSGQDASQGTMGEEFFIPANLIRITSSGEPALEPIVPEEPTPEELDKMFNRHIEQGRY